MKKLFILFAACMLFCGCNEKSNINSKLALPVSVTATIQGVKTPFTQKITQQGYTVSFDKEHPLYGTYIEIWGAKGTADTEGFTRPVDSRSFPAQHALANALQLINIGEVLPVKTKNGFKYTIDETIIMVYYDNRTEEIIGIETEENGRRFYFSVIAITPYEEPSNGEGKS